MPTAPFLRFRSPRWLGVALALLTITCGEPITGPRGGMAELRLLPVYPQLSAATLLIGNAVDNVRVEVRREDNSIAVDTTVLFPAASQTLELTLRFPMSGASEPVTATVQLRAATEVLFEGSLALVATPTGDDGTQPPEIPLDYVGEGADAVTVEVTPSDSTLSSRDSIEFTAIARNAQSSIVAAPIEWTVSPATLGTITAEGKFRGAALPGIATVTATTPTGVLGTATLELEPTLQSLALVSGDQQQAPVVTAFANPLVVRAVDGQTPLPGTIVLWSVTSGRAVLGADADTADAAGLASVTVTADTLAGAVTVRANADGITRDFALSVTAGEATVMEIVDGNAQSANGGSALPARPRVRLLDAYANPVPGVMVSHAVIAGGGSLTPPTDVVSDAAGIVQGPVWTLGLIPGPQRMEAASGCLDASAASTPDGEIAADCLFAEFTATALVPPTMTLQLFSGDGQTAEPGAPLALPLVVLVENSDVPVESVPVEFTVISGGGLLSADTVYTDVNGRAEVNFTVGSTGEQQVRASVGSLQVLFNVTGAPTGFSRVWLGASDDWYSTLNWTGGAVPTETDSVYIPAGTPNAPRLTADATTATIVVDDPRGLDLGASTLTAHGSVRSVAAWTGSGRLEMVGSGGKLVGQVGKTFVLGATTLDGPVTIGDTLRIASNAGLAVGPHLLTVEGALLLTNGGALLMQHASGVVVVEGDASFDGGDMGDTTLTAGLLVLQGNFSSSSCCLQSFRAVGTHRTRFVGPELQTLDMAYASVANSRFQHLELAPGSIVELASDVFALGDVDLIGDAAMTQSSFRTLSVGGALSTDAGSALILSVVAVIDGSGPVFPDIDGARPETLRLRTSGVIPLTESVSHSFGLVVAGGTTLDIGANTLSIDGALSVEESGRLRMLHPASTVIVGGDASFNADDMGDTLLVAGTLELRGDFTAGSSALESFRAAGTHLTRFTGSALQTINMAYPGSANTRFNQLELQNAAGVQLLTHALAHGDVAVIGTTPLSQSGARTLSVGGALTSDAGTLLGISTLTIYNGVGAVFPDINGSYPTTLRLATGTLLALSEPVSMTSSLVLETSTALDPGLHPLTVNGTLTVQTGARLRMLDPAGLVVVVDDAIFNSLDMGDSLFVAGTLELRANLTASSSALESFRAAGTHLTRFNGSALQTINVAYPGAANSLFKHAEFSNAAGVQLLTNAVVNGNVSVTGTTALTETGARTLTVGGAFTSAVGTSVALSTLTVYGGSAPAFPDINGTYPGTIRLASGGLISLTEPVTMSSNLVIETSTSFDPGTHPLSVGGTLNVETGGRLRMLAPSTSVTVLGDAFFNSLEMGDSLFVAGTLELRGDLSAGSSALESFRGAGTHLTRFAGTALQTISVAYPGDLNSRFRDVEFSNAAGVQILTNVFVHGSAVLTGSTPLSQSGVRTLSVGGLLTAPAGTAVNVTTLTVYNGAGATFPNIAGGFPSTIRLASGTLIPLTAPVTMPSNLVIETSTAFDPGPHALSVGGTLDVLTNARLRMLDPAGQVTVLGSANFNSLEMGDSLFVAGTLELHGNLTAGSSALESFRAAGTHLTRLAGTALQTLSFAYPGDNNSRFNALHITNTSAAGVSVSSHVFAVSVNQAGRLTVPLTRIFTITGALQLQSGSNTEVLGSLAFGSCSALGGLFTGFSCP